MATSNQIVNSSYSYLKHKDEKGAISRVAYIILSLLLISAFGPYLAPANGIRLEHIVIYPLALFFGVRYLMVPQKPTPRVYRIIMALWAALIIWMFLITYIQKPSFSFFTIAAMENIIQPLALIFILGELLKRLDYQGQLRFFKTAAWWIIILLALNALLSIATIFLDTWPVVRLFVRGGDLLSTVWGRSVTNGRFIGIFNQPFEAGIAYSVGLMGWMYLLLKQKTMSFFFWILGTMLVIGGLLSISKVFILGGIPAAITYAIWIVNIKSTKRIIGIIIASLAAMKIITSLGKWTGLQYFLRLFDTRQVSEVGAISLYTGGRLGGETSAVTHLFRRVWETSPIVGFGFGVTFALDNAYLEFFYQGGLVAMMLYIAVLTILGVSFFRGLSSGNMEARLAFLLIIIVIFAGLGAPVLTINRASILMWVFLITLLFINWSKQEQSSQTLPDAIPER